VGRQTDFQRCRIRWTEAGIHRQVDRGRQIEGERHWDRQRQEDGQTEAWDICRAEANGI